MNVLGFEERFHGGRTPGCQWRNLAGGSLSLKSWCFVYSHRRWSDLLRSRRCLDHPHQTLEKETVQYPPQLVKTAVKEIMKVESSKQSRSLAWCSVTVDSKSQTQHLVAPAVSSEYPIIQEDAHRRLKKKNSEPWTWPVRKSEKQPEPRSLACAWNLVILVLEE